ncbi:hypothetical protein ACSVHC_21410 [Arthrobacter sp. KNU-44]
MNPDRLSDRAGDALTIAEDGFPRLRHGDESDAVNGYLKYRDARKS